MAVDPRILKLNIAFVDCGWTAELPEVPGCRTHGKTLEEVRERIREALEVSLDDYTPEQAAVAAAEAEFIEHIDYGLPKKG